MIHSFYLHARVGALPAGVEWKPHLFARLIRSATLTLDGWKVCSLKGDDLMLKIHTGLLRMPNVPNHTSLPEHFYSNRPSHVEQEFCIPLFLKEEIGLSLPLAAMLEHRMMILEVEITPFTELILSGAEVVPAEPPSLTCSLRAIGEYYENKPRGNIMRQTHTQEILQLESDTATFTIGESNTVDVGIHSNSIVSTGILHITDESGMEIPQECVDTITVLFNSSVRHYLSGYEAKHMQHTQVPFCVKKVTTSENIYLIPYWIGQGYADANQRRPFGANFGRIESITYRITFKSSVPSRVRITLAHDAQNIFNVNDGIGGVRYTVGYSIDNAAATEAH